MVMYSHVSPDFIIKNGDFVKQGQIIGTVGPKYVYGVPNNPYKDSSRKAYKWSNHRTTSSLLH